LKSPTNPQNHLGKAARAFKGSDGGARAIRSAGQLATKPLDQRATTPSGHIKGIRTSIALFAD